MINIFKRKTGFVAPVTGTLKELDQVVDEAFSSKAMGDGFAIEPESQEIYSPVSGVVESFFPSKHAIGLKSDKGLEVLIHVGVDTVNLKGEGFTAHVVEKQKVKQGDLLLTVDFGTIKDKVPSTDVIVVFTSGEKCEVVKSGKPVDALEKDIIKVH